jgi:hypothetical protein
VFTTLPNVGRKARSVKLPANKYRPQRYHTTMLVSSGGIGLDALTQMQLVLKIRRFCREGWNSDDGDLEHNLAMAEDIESGNVVWHIAEDGGAHYHTRRH